MSEQRCDRCRFWQRTDVYGGDCRRYVPAILQDGHHGGPWPYTLVDSWCGEFKPSKNHPVRALLAKFAAWLTTPRRSARARLNLEDAR